MPPETPLEERVKQTVRDICYRTRRRFLDTVELATDRDGHHISATDMVAVDAFLAGLEDTTRLYFNYTPRERPFHDVLGQSSLSNHLMTNLIYQLSPSETKNQLVRAVGAIVGNHVVIERGVYVDPIFPHLIDIGDHTTLRTGTYLFTHYQQTSSYAVGSIKIGSHVDVDGNLILFGTTLEDNVHIKQGAMIGPSNIRSVPKGTVVGVRTEPLPVVVPNDGTLSSLVYTLTQPLTYFPSSLKSLVYSFFGSEISDLDSLPPYVSIYGRFGGVTIGTGTHIGGRVVLQKYAIGSHKPLRKPVTLIGNNVCIGSLAKIGIDVMIDDCAQIDAGAVVPSGTHVKAGERVRCAQPEIIGYRALVSGQWKYEPRAQTQQGA